MIETKLMKDNDTEADLQARQSKERKLGFLNLELQDIKNNKGNITMQVRSIEHM